MLFIDTKPDWDHNTPMSPDGATLISIIIPAYNEELRLPSLFKPHRFFSGKGVPLKSWLLMTVVRTELRVVERFIAAHPNVNLKRLAYGRNRGKGYAVRYGMLAAAGEMRLFCDADLATPIEEYDVVVDQMKSQSAQVGIGSRPLKTSHCLFVSPYTGAAGRLFNTIVQTLAVRVSRTHSVASRYSRGCC